MDRQRVLDTGILWTANILRMGIWPAQSVVEAVSSRLNSWDWALDEVVEGFAEKYRESVRSEVPTPRLKVERRCECEGCWSCLGHVEGCTCDVDWDEMAERQIGR